MQEIKLANGTSHVPRAGRRTCLVDLGVIEWIELTGKKNREYVYNAPPMEYISVAVRP
jgi:hypothetical protein